MAYWVRMKEKISLKTRKVRSSSGEEVAQQADAGQNTDKVDIKIRDVVEGPAGQEKDDSKEKRRKIICLILRKRQPKGCSSK